MNTLIPLQPHALVAHQGTVHAASDARPGHWFAPTLGAILSPGLDVAGDLLVAVGDRVCCVWHRRTRALVASWAEAAPIAAVALDRPARLLAIATGASVRVYRTDSFALAFAYTHLNQVVSVHVGASGILASADQLGNIHVYATSTGTALATMQHGPGTLVVFVAPDGDFVVSQSTTEVAFLAVDPARVLRRFSLIESPPRQVSPLCLGISLIAPLGNRVRLFDTAAAGAFRDLVFDSPVTSVDTLEHRSLMLITTQTGQIGVYHWWTGRCHATYKSYSNPLWCARFNGGPDRILAAAGEGLVMEIEGGRHVHSYCESPPIVSAHVHNRSMLLLGDRTGRVTGYDLRAARRRDISPVHIGSTSAIACNDAVVATGGYDGACQVTRWDGRTVAVFAPRRGPVQALALSPDGDTIWIGTRDGTVSAFSLETLQSLCVIEDRPKPIRSLALSVDGAQLLVGDDGGQLCLRDLGHGGRVIARDELGHAVYRCCFDPQGDVLAIAGEGVVRCGVGMAGRVQRYRATNLRDFTLLDNGQVSSLSLTGELAMFDPSGACVARTQLTDSRAHRAVLAWPQRVATASADGTVRVFDYSLRPLAELKHLPQAGAVMWMTTPRDDHPGWLHATHPDRMLVGEIDGDQRRTWPLDDPRRAAHLELYSSRSHVIQVLTGNEESIPPSRLARTTSILRLPG